MENFFIEENFYRSLKQYKAELLESFESIADLPEDFTVQAQNSTLEKIFTLDIDEFAYEIAEGLMDENWERVNPDFVDETREKLIDAIKPAIDIKLLNSSLPEFYYPNNTFFYITKDDLLNH